MKVIAAGFGLNDYEILAQTFEKLIVENECYLFTIVCGGLDEREYTMTAADLWAEKNGAPRIYLFEEDMNRLAKKIVKECDYIIAKAGGGPMVTKLLGLFQAEGKHGTVVRV